MLEMNLDLNEKETIEFNLENGSTSGTSNYEELKNKPSINGNELVGNKTTEELGILNEVEEYIEENKADFKGEPGEPGKSGVYVGSEEPDDDSNVWIDPDGMPTEGFIKQNELKDELKNNIKTINNQSLVGDGNINIEDFIMIQAPDVEPNLIEKLLLAIDENNNIVKPLYMMLENQALSLEVVTRNEEGLVFKFHSSMMEFMEDCSRLDIQEHYIMLSDDGGITWDGNGASIPDMAMLYQKADKVKVETPEITTIAIIANTYYQFGEVSLLDIRLAEIIDETTLHEYMFEFVSGDTATTLILPDTIKWLEEPTIEANKTYQCSIVNNIGVLLGV